jgi:hypothetical protein
LQNSSFLSFFLHFCFASLHGCHSPVIELHHIGSISLAYLFLVNRKLKLKHQIDHSFKPFTPALTKSAIERTSNSTAQGPDGLTSLHLKFLGPLGIAYLTELHNLSIAHANIPVV